MKKLFVLSGFLLVYSSTIQASAQETIKEEVKEGKKEVKEAGKNVKKGAVKAGNKTAEVASKGKARITDTEHKDKVGPNGETIYIDNHARYYWIDKEGRRHYVIESELKNRNQ